MAEIRIGHSGYTQRHTIGFHRCSQLAVAVKHCIIVDTCRRGTEGDITDPHFQTVHRDLAVFFQCDIAVAVGGDRILLNGNGLIGCYCAGGNCKSICSGIKNADCTVAGKGQIVAVQVDLETVAGIRNGVIAVETNKRKRTGCPLLLHIGSQGSISGMIHQSHTANLDRTVPLSKEHSTGTGMGELTGVAAAYGFIAVGIQCDYLQLIGRGGAVHCPAIGTIHAGTAAPAVTDKELTATVDTNLVIFRFTVCDRSITAQIYSAVGICTDITAFGFPAFNFAAQHVKYRRIRGAVALQMDFAIAGGLICNTTGDRAACHQDAASHKLDIAASCSGVTVQDLCAFSDGDIAFADGQIAAAVAVTGGKGLTLPNDRIFKGEPGILLSCDSTGEFRANVATGLLRCTLFYNTTGHIHSSLVVQKDIAAIDCCAAGNCTAGHIEHRQTLFRIGDIVGKVDVAAVGAGSAAGNRAAGHIHHRTAVNGDVAATGGRFAAFDGATIHIEGHMVTQDQIATVAVTAVFHCTGIHIDRQLFGVVVCHGFRIDGNLCAVGGIDGAAVEIEGCRNIGHCASHIHSTAATAAFYGCTGVNAENTAVIADTYGIG